ncbi:MAG: polyprenyl synthetase family protein [bacterium]
MDFSKRYAIYCSRIDRYLAKCVHEQYPETVYEPVKYVLAGGGKRIRPVLVILSCEAVGGTMKRALHAATAIEILHNFTLVHDDIMDHANSRRGRPTVHVKWDSNIALLSGDVLLALAYRTLLRTRSPHIQKISDTFTEGVIEVCEGQGYDKEFETSKHVTMNDYLRMIGKKTGKLVSASTVIGALIGNANATYLRALHYYGALVGRAFQIQDDLLDIVANEAEFGKKIGGDLLEGKKTFLLLAALQRASGKDKKLLDELVKNHGIPARLIPRFREIYHNTGAVEMARRHILGDIRRAMAQLQLLPSSPARSMLQWLTDRLLNRTY